MKMRSVRWRSLEDGGLEHLTLSLAADSIVAKSVVIGARGGRAYGVRYGIVCDAGWVVRSFDVETTDGRSLRWEKDRRGRWTDENGAHLAGFDGCIDVDLSGTPFTNTLPIRRLDLEAEDGTVELAMLFVPFDSFTPRVERQRYTCLKPRSLYRFALADESFTADLPVDADGLVTDYPGLFERVRE
jgi:hypothetical protein